MAVSSGLVGHDTCSLQLVSAIVALGEWKMRIGLGVITAVLLTANVMHWVRRIAQERDTTLDPASERLT